MIQIILTTHILEPLQIILLFVVFALFIGVFIANRIILRRMHRHAKQSKFANQVMQEALKNSQNNVLQWHIREKYSTQLYGQMLPCDTITDEDWKRHVHPDDLLRALRFLHDLRDGKIKSADFNYRWNYEFDNKKPPRWGYFNNTSVAEYLPDHDLPVSIISTLTDETDMRQSQREERILADKFKLLFEHSIVGMSFYSPEGWLLDSNKIMREVCHFDTDDSDAFFYQNNLFDLPPFSELIKRDQVEEFWVCYQSIIPERNIHDYLEIHLHPIYNDWGNIIYLAVSVRNITEERELYLQNRLNDVQLRHANEEIKQYEIELRYLMENCQMQPWRIRLKENIIEFYKDLTTIDKTFTLEQLHTIFYNQEDDFVRAMQNPAEALSKPVSWVGQMHPVVSEKYKEPQWVVINSIPEYDEQGQMTGSFGIWRNIQGLMQKQEQLKRETERANDSGHQKSVFLANMTHEIRTPLNAIVGFSDLLQAMEQPEEKRELIRIIHNNCDMLLRLINDILVLSSVDSTGLELISERIDFSKEFDIICQSLAQRIEEPGVEFQKENPLPSLMVTIDNRRIQQVITNFVTNAVKNTHQGHIRVGYRVEEQTNGRNIYVYCEDTGSGIPEDAKARIFERFVKLNDFVQGTGLGLSICKAIIEKCGGEIGVDSEIGKGSTFWFRIPI
ncbi:MAG: HAMP domain-containing histidine kinase [Prevotella sp.]|nr:HAMP domain-containing histidine kinase [Prevotella sp.]